METALRRYSVLSVDSHIVIEHGNMRYYVRVAELKPASVVSLCGDVDLETDFMPPEVHPKRPTTGKLYASHNDTSVQSTTSGEISIIDSAVPPTDIASTSSICYGRRLRDGGYVISNRSIPAGTTASTLGKPSNKCNLKSLQTAQKLVRDKQSTSICTDAVAAATDSAILASQLRSAQAAFSTPGFALGTAQQAPISNCSVAPVTVVKQQFIDNGSQVDLEQVARSDCNADLGLFTCKLCLTDISSINMELHALRCVKNPTYHKVTAAVQDHATPNPIPSVVSPPRVKASHHNDVECAYCLQGGFANIAAVEHHALNDCRIAKSFVSSESVHIARSNQEEVEPAHAASSENTKEPHCSDVIRPLLAQGRMRRKDDTNALRGDPPLPQEPPLTRGSRSNQACYLSTPLSIYTPAGPSRRTHQAGKLRKPKPRPNPQLRALPQRTQDTVSTFNGPRVTNINQNLSSGPAELCISSAGGTSHRALAPTIRSQGPTRLRRRATSNFPPPGGLDKLA
ncbi:unnamed protein product [Phytophthora lilii]|uniref:Unnamed protein product n=1 Tax=Phytophthora lilii TaxID=2077276 RepID=A0A9W6TAY6_9STRA|nr:unnamed protein product [Phytophthora lilii]